ncbi:MAG: polysaccharide biosynthesis/export family protein [Myxococcales bacterium]|nr:polysaccharide biosynthesis/export family protein [Myxococcales bacterium]
MSLGRLPLGCLFLALCSTARAADYRIGPGDEILIHVHGQALGPDGHFVVADNGDVSLPCAELVPVSGQTAHEIERSVRSSLMPDCYIDPQVTVRVVEHGSKPVEVLGAVHSPGVYYLDGRNTVRSVVSRAGGVKSERSTGRIVVNRKGEEPLRIPLDELDVLGDLLLVSGDVITVDEGRIVFVAGEVAKPGQIAFAEGITVSEAFIKAGGQTAVARLSGSYVLRQDDKIQVNLRRVLKGKDADLQLQPGDRLVIPESPL